MPLFNIDDRKMGELQAAAGSRWDRVRGILGLLGDKADDLEARAADAVETARQATQAAVVAAGALGKTMDEAVAEVTQVVDRAAAEAKATIGEIPLASGTDEPEAGKNAGTEGGSAEG